MTVAVATRRSVAVLLTVLALLACSAAHPEPPRRPPQPMGLAYQGDGGVGAYARPGALVVAGRENLADAAFVAVSRAGGHVLAYLDPIIDNRFGRYHQLLLADSPCGPGVPRWRGVPRANRWGFLTDFRVGGALQRKLSCVLETMVAENPHLAGWFADDVGSRSWFPGIDWSTFAEKQAYRDGAVALVRTFREVADRHGLVVVVNGTWSRGGLDRDGGGYPDPAQDGNALADGGFVENHDGQVAVFGPYACSPQWAAGSATTRGLAMTMTVTRTPSGREEYASTGCFAYLTTQQDYGEAPPPWGPFTSTGLPTRARSRRLRTSRERPRGRLTSASTAS